MSEAQFVTAYESGAEACVFFCDLQARADGPLEGRRRSGRRSSREVLPRDPDLWLYRDRTQGLLRRYYRASIEAGRLPSLLGRELFRTRASAYRVATFEDAVIFVRDVERRLEQLDDFERELLLKVIAEDHTQDEAGQLLGCGRRTIGRRLAQALDCLTEMFLDCGLLLPLPNCDAGDGDECQEEETDESVATYSEQAK